MSTTSGAGSEVVADNQVNPLDSDGVPIGPGAHVLLLVETRLGLRPSGAAGVVDWIDLELDLVGWVDGADRRVHSSPPKWLRVVDTVRAPIPQREVRAAARAISDFLHPQRRDPQ